ncbi:MAG TPA: DegT/DnrJ/EryC1/StrS family aminotransferase [Candidatus Dormibacteraeota bacterium]|nr:DegT/DnrJ/EryC1/StrS family aminotransferase [Candidatus Dormibacteraeota bacterium]
MPRRRIPFNTLLPTHRLLAEEIQVAVDRVLASANYILGPELEAFETRFATYLGVRHAVGVASGTDAIELALRAAGVGEGAEVITVSHTAVATVCAIERAGATPVLVEIDPLAYTIDVSAVEAAITPRTAAIVPVHLYGRACDMTALQAIAKRHGLVLLEDCAQAHGASHRGRKVGTFGELAAFSFYPTKNLGAYGDAGAVVTDDDRLAERLRRLRNYGQTERHKYVEPGFNSRLDEMQAAILSVRLDHLDEHNRVRQELAGIYCETTHGVALPAIDRSDGHVFHLFVIRHPRRDGMREWLERHDVETAIHYPIPVHLAPAYSHLGVAAGSLPTTERCTREIISLPMYIGLTHDDVRRVGSLVTQAAEELAAC